MNHFRIRVLDHSRKVVFERVIEQAPSPATAIVRPVLLADASSAAAEENEPLTLRLPPNLPGDEKACIRVSVAMTVEDLSFEGKRWAAMQLTNPWAKLAAAYHLVGDHQAVDKLAEQYPAAAVALGDIYAEEEDWERAITEYNKAISDQTVDGNLLAKRAVAYDAIRRWDLAIADWQRAVLKGMNQEPAQVRRLSESADRLLKSGIDAARQGRHAEAIRDLEPARDRFRIWYQAIPENEPLAGQQFAVSLAALRCPESRHFRPADALVRLLTEAGQVLEGLRQPTFMDLYNLAGVYANLSTMAESNAAGNALADRAMDALQRSLAAGMKDFPLIERDHDLDPVRDRADFRTMILEATRRSM